MQNSHKKNCPDLCGAILAGGQSRRMGRDKAGLMLANQSLFDGVRRALLNVCDQILVAGDRPDLADASIPVYPDRFPGSSLGGLHTALQAATRNWVCLLPCDLPYPSPELLRTLLGLRGEFQAVVPRHPAGSEPLVACYRRDCLPLLESQLQDGNYRLTDFLNQLKVRYVGPNELPSGWRRALTNLNRPEDLERALAAPPVVTFIARSGTGKTTLLEQLIRELTARGWTVGALKHDAHRFEIDHQGKDSWRFAQAGATLTAISSPAKTAFIRRHELEPDLQELLQPFSGQVDILLTEGFKRSSLPKIEVYRGAVGEPLLSRGAHNDPALVAVVSDTPFVLDVPCLDLADPQGLADFIEARFLS